ncbi:hypothetical protein DFH09DRAFT_1166549 [Mycena vulgaris]|nr:hypothetical protein DFH09DRAFT_1166549 [Mycena vulgaris]
MVFWVLLLVVCPSVTGIIISSPGWLVLHSSHCRKTSHCRKRNTTRRFHRIVASPPRPHRHTLHVGPSCCSERLDRRDPKREETTHYIHLSRTWRPFFQWAVHAETFSRRRNRFDKSLH